MGCDAVGGDPMTDTGAERPQPTATGAGVSDRPSAPVSPIQTTFDAEQDLADYRAQSRHPHPDAVVLGILTAVAPEMVLAAVTLARQWEREAQEVPE